LKPFLRPSQTRGTSVSSFSFLLSRNNFQSCLLRILETFSVSNTFRQCLLHAEPLYCATQLVMRSVISANSASKSSPFKCTRCRDKNNHLPTFASQADLLRHEKVHGAAVNRSQVRYCYVCDQSYELRSSGGHKCCTTSRLRFLV
jgi:hypothetical protein